ncbi:hypothetical protein DFA_07845 [Cavenderia fasciculata]|uniref:Uncharacterized protein n=1 Tax=Cavenderia fasciculata TaxID=261658 RepID=F4Q3P9_CACFS|nr:uncharacterized protein DFA_07845 [Cavenderia fasciculata]EGG16865.1 hypothetical protein DFA_07845 [Cavenderia fasciculata]|eukprot:XP_004355339.1 hypothetical protein DFA_07845 [Cavenderia fasciculata]
MINHITNTNSIYQSIMNNSNSEMVENTEPSVNRTTKKSA